MSGAQRSMRERTELIHSTVTTAAETHSQPLSLQPSSLLPKIISAANIYTRPKIVMRMLISNSQSKEMCLRHQLTTILQQQNNDKARPLSCWMNSRHTTPSPDRYVPDRYKHWATGNSGATPIGYVDTIRRQLFTRSRSWSEHRRQPSGGILGHLDHE